MTQDDSKLIGACAVGCGFGVYLFFKGFRQFREYRVVADTPVIPIRSVPMGLVQIRGEAKGDAPVSSPISHVPCYWYRVVIEQWKSRSSSGREEHYWEHICTESDGVKFYLQDATGHIRVDARQAELDLPQSAQRIVARASSARVGTQATDEELLQYVSKAQMHRIGNFVSKGIEHFPRLANPEQEAKRQMLASMFQSTPGSPEFMQKIIPLMAPMMKQRLESIGAQADTQKEQARQAALAAFNYPPGSPEFMKAAESAAAMAGEKPDAISKLERMFQPTGEFSNFSPASGRYRLTESLIVADGTYDITGTCAENPEPADEHDRNMIGKGQNEPTFLISSKTKQQEESSLRWHAVGKIFGGAALSVVCLAIILAKLKLLF